MNKPCSGAKIVELIVCPIELAECGHAPARPIERCAGCDGQNLPANVRRSIDAAKARAVERALIERGVSPEDAKTKYDKTKKAGCSGCGGRK